MAAEKILVVDDEQSMTQFLGIVLRKDGFQVTTVNSGRDALDKIRSEPFDVVISDIKMPGMDGIQLLQGIKKHDANIPVVLMTAYASQQSAIDAVNLGAFQYLLKNAKNDSERSVQLYCRTAASTPSGMASPHVTSAAALANNSVLARPLRSTVKTGRWRENDSPKSRWRKMFFR